MKIRIGYVSNSSSSSFVITKDDFDIYCPFCLKVVVDLPYNCCPECGTEVLIEDLLKKVDVRKIKLKNFFDENDI